MKEFYSLTEVADMLSVSKETLRRWDKNNYLKPIRHPINNYRVYPAFSLKKFEQLGFLFDNNISINEKPLKDFSLIELFSGAGGLALGLETAGLKCELLNDNDRNACNTLKKNRPGWNIIEGDVSQLDFSPYKGKIDVVAGGFPCQAFSYAGKKLGLKDARGTLFYEFARAVDEIKPLICVGENVRGLLNHENGNTLQGMISVLDELGYDVIPPRVLKAIFYRVPQKRERLLLVGLKRGCGLNFDFPQPHKEIYTLKDALKKGRLFDSDVPPSPGQLFSPMKKRVMQHVPPGGYWRDLPIELQKEYMKSSFFQGGGKTGMARRMHWDEPCLTLTCNPSQKQTERCHPEETRPFTVREYARIQTFPDNWEFVGSLSSQYKQIGNAVPVNFAREVGYALIKTLNAYYSSTMQAKEEMQLAI
ncbi:MAG: DNA (cytosine-5-)-methyltransferase [Verrucomicrobia bacterium CG_4_10_14_3_um_filter_43_23]|nr:MAG: DNA (cytosine-5-)-methyltransferase [Verrucomicrobia bacterium CG1_02_43_26]PIP59507.1 MAG: DNA (cytosine-5-)-methyltransferase [Verrucomicrobia bacterium CG22_combo_CG10-13_8_21_14_all_43_17]PIX58808.1 MAG: DNA (cytosine-5-)-methyltransferase [Verrucomicrobia bacterium CG_4_10_14_3_um_filter_43_23]PIY60904.1 MAG: DNA (cytosine-5-)-methyltransferase [Verrucomicrobia bacterium CG_4_10_14_0_8_um_filter_43_34]PJA44602.1 MAG: DNA (cytosine-5-)-methyltransferase [Verrucomicrobia bacterium CG